MTPTTPLNARQIKFCEEYIQDFNATQAALRAGYTPSSAASTGCRLLQYPVIKAFIAQLRGEQRKRNKAVSEKLKQELFTIAFSDISDFVDPQEDGPGLRIVGQNKRRAISSVHISKSKNKNGGSQQLHVKMHNKMDALKILAKHIGFFEEKPKSPDEYIHRPTRREPSLDELLREEKYMPKGLPEDTEKDGELTE